jgi:nucleoside diphosphate kinase
MIHVCQFLAGVEVSELSAYHYEEKLAEQFYQEELSSGIGNSLIDLNED